MISLNIVQHELATGFLEHHGLAKLEAAWKAANILVLACDGQRIAFAGAASHVEPVTRDGDYFFCVDARTGELKVHDYTTNYFPDSLCITAMQPYPRAEGMYWDYSFLFRDNRDASESFRRYFYGTTSGIIFQL